MAELVGTRASTESKLQEIKDQLGLVTDKVGDVPEAHLMQLEQPQECMFGIVESTMADKDQQQDNEGEEKSSSPHSLAVPLLEFSLAKVEGSVHSSLLPDMPIADSVMSRQCPMSKRGKLWRKKQKEGRKCRASMQHECRQRSSHTLCT